MIVELGIGAGLAVLLRHLEKRYTNRMVYNPQGGSTVTPVSSANQNVQKVSTQSAQSKVSTQSAQSKVPIQSAQSAERLKYKDEDFAKSVAPGVPKGVYVIVKEGADNQITRGVVSKDYKKGGYYFKGWAIVETNYANAYTDYFSFLKSNIEKLKEPIFTVEKRFIESSGMGNSEYSKIKRDALLGVAPDIFDLFLRLGVRIGNKSVNRYVRRNFNISISFGNEPFYEMIYLFPNSIEYPYGFLREDHVLNNVLGIKNFAFMPLGVCEINDRSTSNVLRVSFVDKVSFVRFILLSTICNYIELAQHSNTIKTGKINVESVYNMLIGKDIKTYKT